MPQFSTYPVITTLASTDTFLVHQQSSGQEKQIATSNAAASFGVSSVASIAALKALDVTAIQNRFSILVAGYYTANDNGGGVFVYNSTSVATANEGTIVAPSAGSGKWYRVFSGPLDVAWFGARFDGTDDSSYVQAAINAAMASGGDTTVAGGGTVVINKALDLGTTTINVGSTSGETGGKPINLQLQFFGNLKTGANPGFQLASRSRIQGINRRHTRITKTGSGPIIQVTAPAEDGDISDLHLEGGANAIKIRASGAVGNAPGWRIQRIFAQSQTGDGIALCGMSDGFLLDECYINSSAGSNLRVGVMDAATGGASNENAMVSNNLFSGAGAKAIWIESDQATLQASQAMVNTSFINNQITSPTNDGFFFKMLSPGGIQILNTMFFAGPTGAANTYSAFSFDSGYGAISGVDIDGVGGSATNNWKYIVSFPGPNWGPGNRVRGYINAGAGTSVLNLPAGSFVRVDEVLTTSLPATHTQRNYSGITGLKAGAYQIAGNVGEVISSFVTSVNAVSLVNATSKDVTTIALTKGNWLINSVVHIHGTNATTISYVAAGVGGTANTLPSKDTGQRVDTNGAFATILTDLSYPIPGFTLSLSADTTYHLVVQAGFAVDVLGVYGSIIATRIP